MCRNVKVEGCDIFLLEKWDESSSLSDDEQLTQIFSSYIQMPYTERYVGRLIQHRNLEDPWDLGATPHIDSKLVYTQHARDQGFQRLTDLPQADQDLLNRLRTPEEFQNEDMIWLRTCYEDGSDAAFSAFMSAKPDYTALSVFQDARRYNYGGGDGWRRIFTRLPQLLDPGNTSPDVYEDTKHRVLMECYEDEQQDTKEVEEQGGDVEEDGTYWVELYSYFHYVSMVGMIHVVDDETLRVAAEDPASAKALTVWFDEMGRVIKHTRLTAKETLEFEGVLITMGSALIDKGQWGGAKLSEDYDWEGPFGPPSLTGEGSEAS